MRKIIIRNIDNAPNGKEFFAGISGRKFWHRRDGEWQRKTFRQRFPEWKQCTGK